MITAVYEGVSGVLYFFYSQSSHIYGMCTPHPHSLTESCAPTYINIYYIYIHTFFIYIRRWYISLLLIKIICMPNETDMQGFIQKYSKISNK